MRISKIVTMTAIIFLLASTTCFSANLTGIWDVTVTFSGSPPNTEGALIVQTDDQTFTYMGMPGKIKEGKYILAGPFPGRVAIKGIWVEVQRIILSPDKEDHFKGKTFFAVYDFKESTNKIMSADALMEGVKVMDPAPLIILLGDKEAWIKAGSEYADPGAKAFDEKGTDLTARMKVVSTVNPKTPGDYAITYNVAGANNKPAKEAARKVHIVSPAPPRLTLKGDPVVNTEKGKGYVDAGTAAVSFLNEDLSKKVKILVNGTPQDPNTIDTQKPKAVYEIAYSVEDENGKAEVKRTVNIIKAKDEESFFKYCFISTVMN
jgi:hypothetical protein